MVYLNFHAKENRAIERTLIAKEQASKPKAKQVDRVARDMYNIIEKAKANEKL